MFQILPVRPSIMENVTYLYITYLSISLCGVYEIEITYLIPNFNGYTVEVWD